MGTQPNQPFPLFSTFTFTLTILFLCYCINMYSYIVSDCDSVGVLYASQHYASSPEKAAAAAIKAGKLTIPSHTRLKHEN